MVGMDQVVCQECVEVVFIDASMACGRFTNHLDGPSKVSGGAKLHTTIFVHFG